MVFYNDGGIAKQSDSLLSFVVPQNPVPLGDQDLRAQKIATKRVGQREYQKLMEKVNLYDSRYLMLHSPRDPR
jgi:hypothetical protein